MELWYTEYQTDNLGITCKIKKTLHTEKSDYQDIAIIETNEFGKMLVLDGTVQTTDRDEFVYHEMITHVPLFTHKNPKKALVIGGGDGGSIREILKHPSIEKAVLVDIDGRVIEVARQHFPQISCKLDDERAEVRVEDGIKFIQNHRNEFDVIMIDSTDPVGPAEGLFAKEFYQSIWKALKDDGVFVAQTESPFLHQDLIKKVYDDVSSIFEIANVYTCVVPTYPSGFWSFTIGSKKYNPEQVDDNRFLEIETKYFTKEIYKASFAIPKFLKDKLDIK